MRDEETKFEKECTARDRYHHFVNKVRAFPKSRPLSENLAAIRGIRQVPGRWVKPFPKSDKYRRPGSYRLITFPYYIYEV